MKAELQLEVYYETKLIDPLLNRKRYIQTANKLFNPIIDNQRVVWNSHKNGSMVLGHLYLQLKGIIIFLTNESLIVEFAKLSWLIKVYQMLGIAKTVKLAKVIELVSV